MEKKPLVRVPVLNKPAKRFCPKCRMKLFDDDWPMHTIATLLYKPFCPNCGQNVDWENCITVRGEDDDA